MLYSPKKSDIGKAQSELQAEKQTEQTLRTQLKRRQDLKAQEAKLDLRKATLATFIPDDPLLAQFINDATGIAKASGIDFISIAPSVPSGGPAGQGVISLRISIKG